MKKLCLLTLALCFQLLTYAQITTQWTTSTPSAFTMTAASGGIRGNTTTSYSNYANSKQKLTTCEDGYAEFDVYEPEYFSSAVSAHHQIGFAKASDPGVMLIGFDFISGAPGSPGYVYAGANGSLILPLAGSTANYNMSLNLITETGGSGCAIPAAGTRFRIERVNNVIHFRNVTDGCELFYLTTGTFPVSPNEDWIIIFKSSYTTLSVTGINNCKVSFSGFCGEEKLWTRLNSTSIRPLNMSDKIGIGKDPVANLDVLGTARVSTLANADPYVLTNDANGQLSLSATKLSQLKTWEITGNNVFSGHGTNGYPSGNVGIGTATPAYKLTVGTDPVGGRVLIDGSWTTDAAVEHSRLFFNDKNFGMGTGHFGPGSDDDLYIYAYDGDGRDIRFMATSDGASGVNTMGGFGIPNWRTNMIVKNTGFVGIGVLAPSYRLDVAGTMRVGTTVYSSDARFKSNIVHIDNAIEIIKKLNGHTYNFKVNEFPDWHFDSEKQYGFIAQEMQTVLPELVQKDNEGYLGIKYVELIPLLTEAIKEQQVMIEQLKAQIEAGSGSGANKTKGVLGTAGDNGKAPRAAVNKSAQLFQNVPNPLTNLTFIDYYLPETVKSAFIKVTDNNGKLIQAFQLTKTGYGQLELDCTNLAAGTYRYSLITDDQLIETKTMIIVKD
jgi:hypothetical protein